MPTRCDFMYDHPDSVYYSGDVINGKIVLTTDKSKSVRGVYLTVKGIAKVKWTERKSRHNHHTKKQEYYTVEYRGEEQYLHSRTLVEGEMELPPGIHEYTFTTPLPHQVPSSISGEHGHVSYEVELKLDRPFRPDAKYSNCFTVIRPLNLNVDPSYALPIVEEEQKYFGCCCCESGPMNSEFRTEFSGYAPGQKINFTILIDNEANKDILECSVDLIQTIAFKSSTPEHKTKYCKYVLESIRLEGANRFCKKLHHGSIRVPSVPPSTTVPSDIISVSYSLKAEIESGLCSGNEELTAPITIGTVPLIASATNPNSVITVQPTAPTPDSNIDGNDKPPQYGSIVPPSFEEATGMNKPFVDTDVVDENRIQDPYVPKYPVYHNFATPSAPGDEAPSYAQSSAPPAASAPENPSDTNPTTSHAPLPYPVDGFAAMPVPGASGFPSNSSNNEGKQGGPRLGWNA